MKIYTKTGDAGETGLYGGVRVSKSSYQIQAIGDVDELNSVIGMIRSASLSAGVSQRLARIQNRLFDLGARLARSPGTDAAARVSELGENAIAQLENWIDEMQSELPELKQFILPSGIGEASTAHLARSVCRRAERSVIRYVTDESISDLRDEQVFLNRLSDFFFVLARWLNHSAGQEETFWEQSSP